MTWCTSVGGQVPKHDLVGKLSKLATSGRHPQNAERDLQRAIKKYSKSVKVQISTARVRMLDPSTSEIYLANLPILDPVSWATALWHEGQDVFESVFLGHGGREGAQRFWRNAKENCSWFKDTSIPPEVFSGLLPLNLYGDDVQAYRNSDPGAVSVVGWGCDFSFQNEAMFQTFLATIYSEYCSCPHTYNDILEHMLPMLQRLADPAAGHPWEAAGFRFMLAGVRGDLKWLNVA